MADEEKTEKRILGGKSVTDTLMSAMENAERMKHVIVLYETQHDNKRASGGIYTQDDMTLAQINWLLDMGKHWLWGE
jgi:hypothetical protein